ncbi:MAG: twin-arginine translocation signal domain-containing protein [Gemmatimonadetes bacterium]|nr:twin-arginine translocation signal domain-containing protein [Gemmatimonadota bacterium]
MRTVSRRSFLQASGSLAGAGLLGDAALPADELRLAITAYERYAPLISGDVSMADPKLVWVRGPRSEMLDRAQTDPGLHGGERSMLGHLLKVAGGDDSLAAVPVFLLRNFTARDLYTRKGAELAPDELNGQRIGIYNWAASGAVWYRHFVRWLGQDPKSIRWVVGGADTPNEAPSLVPFPPHVTHAPVGRTLSDMLLAGELAAFFAPGVPRRHDAEQGPIVRVVPDFRSVEKRYYRDTGCYPPQHVLALRKGILEGMPSVGAKLVETFQACERSFVAARTLFPYGTPWEMEDLEDTVRVLGAGFHEHGLERNRHALETFLKAAHDDGMTDRVVTVEEYFREFLAG